MLPSEYLKLNQSQQSAVLSGVRRQGDKSASPMSLIQSLNKFRSPDKVNSTYVARIQDYYVDTTNFPKLHIKSQILNSGGDGVWTQEIVFLSPDLSPLPSPKRLGIRIKNDKGQDLGEMWYLGTMPVTTPVKVRCSCPDFRHTFSWEDYDVNSLKGRKLSYLSSGTRAPRNPDSIPGICKHLGSLINVIQKSTDLLQKSPTLRPASLYR